MSIMDNGYLRLFMFLEEHFVGFVVFKVIWFNSCLLLDATE